MDEWPHTYSAPVGQSEALPVPMFISDTMEPTEHVDGKLYTSKSQFRATTKAHGFIEVGNDPARLRPKPRVKTTRAEIKESVQKAAARIRAGERI
jgi:hypothetical protein